MKLSLSHHEIRQRGVTINHIMRDKIAKPNLYLYVLKNNWQKRFVVIFTWRIKMWVVNRQIFLFMFSILINTIFPKVRKHKVLRTSIFTLFLWWCWEKCLKDHFWQQLNFKFNVRISMTKIWWFWKMRKWDQRIQSTYDLLKPNFQIFLN